MDVLLPDAVRVDSVKRTAERHGPLRPKGVSNSGPNDEKRRRMHLGHVQLDGVDGHSADSVRLFVFGRSAVPFLRWWSAVAVVAAAAPSRHVVWE